MQISIHRLKAWYQSSEEKKHPALEEFSDSIDISSSPELLLEKINKRMARRLSPLTKMTVEMAWQVHSQSPPINYMVFSSRHGEIKTSTELIDLIADDELLSPMKFSQSVHNTSAGQFAIFHGEKAPSTSIAAGENSFAAGLVLAGNYSHLHPDHSILYIFSDRTLPERYHSAKDANLDSTSLVIAMAISQQKNFELNLDNQDTINRQDYEVDTPEKLIEWLNRKIIRS